MNANKNTPPPRLIAYGGTSFTERQRIGRWSPIPLGSLQDRYGLGGGATAYGVVLLENRAILLLRQLQNTWNRGGYAFTLLLDPGDAVWQRFEWNGAALAHAILENPEAANVLLTMPQECSPKRLEQTLLGLQAPALAIGDDPNLPALWVGATATPGHTVLPGSVTAPVLASILQGVPTPFRLGPGFIVSGARAHGVALGARLVWDQNGGIIPNLDSLVKRGSALIAAWRSLERQSRTRLGDLCETPFWHWPTGYGGTLDPLLAGLPVLKHLLGALRSAMPPVNPSASPGASADYHTYL